MPPACTHFRLVAVALAALTAGASAQAPTDLRLALVIGNAAYAAAPLLNPANDAKAMSEALKGMGFTVIEARDASRAQMQQALTQAGATLKGKNGVGMLYYAGHGLQLDWHNYMVPVDARFSSAAEVPAQTVDVQAVIDAFRSAGNRMNIIVLDACRDNPFAATASAKGLAPMDAPPGTLLAYATAPGNVAEDGDAKSGNGLYTQFLVHELTQPAAKIEDVFKRVRLQVREQSKGRQIPWESTSLEDDFYFPTGIKTAARPTPRVREQAFNQEKADWDRVAASKNPDDLYTFLKKYPNGSISELAQAQLERLQAARIVAQPERDGAVQVVTGARIRDGDRFEFVFRDGLTGVVSGRASAVLKALGDDEFEGVGTGMGSTRTNAAGFIREFGGTRFDPPWSAVPGGQFQLGKKWSARTIRTAPNGESMWVDIESHIAAREKVTVPLGTFDTYRVDVAMLAQNGDRTRQTIWFDPSWGYAMKVVTELRSRGAAPNITIREVTARSRTN